MKPKQPLSALLGTLLLLGGLTACVLTQRWFGAIPSLIGLSLLYLGYRPGRGATMLFGHALIVTGCLLVTWGIYLLPYSQPKFLHIVGRPLFWGLICIFGGLCANYHGFCRCAGNLDSGSGCASSPPNKCESDNGGGGCSSAER